MKLSIIIPVYNEQNTIEILLSRVASAKLGNVQKEIIVINDGSTDDTKNILQRLHKKYLFKYLNHISNKGKSSAIRKGIKVASGEYIVIQDGDLEYDPNDFKVMIDYIKKNKCKVVYGSRRLCKQKNEYSGISFYIGGLLLTNLTNLLYGSHLTDEPTCYKMFESSLLKNLKLKSKRFEFCPEVTAYILNNGIEIKEVPITYIPRHINQGKKIRLRDFFEAVYTLVKIKVIK